MASNIRGHGYQLLEHGIDPLGAWWPSGAGLELGLGVFLEMYTMIGPEVLDGECGIWLSRVVQVEMSSMEDVENVGNAMVADGNKRVKQGLGRLWASQGVNGSRPGQEAPGARGGIFEVLEVGEHVVGSNHGYVATVQAGEGGGPGMHDEQ